MVWIRRAMALTASAVDQLILVHTMAHLQKQWLTGYNKDQREEIDYNYMENKQTHHLCVYLVEKHTKTAGVLQTQFHACRDLALTNGDLATTYKTIPITILKCSYHDFWCVDYNFSK